MATHKRDQNAAFGPKEIGPHAVSFIASPTENPSRTSNDEGCHVASLKRGLGAANPVGSMSDGEAIEQGSNMAKQSCGVRESSTDRTKVSN